MSNLPPCSAPNWVVFLWRATLIWFIICIQTNRGFLLLGLARCLGLMWAWRLGWRLTLSFGWSLGRRPWMRLASVLLRLKQQRISVTPVLSNYFIWTDIWQWHYEDLLSLFYPWMLSGISDGDNSHREITCEILESMWARTEWMG